MKAIGPLEKLGALWCPRYDITNEKLLRTLDSSQGEGSYFVNTQSHTGTSTSMFISIRREWSSEESGCLNNFSCEYLA